MAALPTGLRSVTKILREAPCEKAPAYHTKHDATQEGENSKQCPSNITARSEHEAGSAVKLREVGVVHCMATAGSY